MKRKEFDDVVNNYISKEMKLIDEHEKIKEILEKCKGKQFNFRTFNEKTLNGFKFKAYCSMFYICKDIDHLIGYASTDGVDPELFEELDSCCGNAAKARIASIKKMDMSRVFKLYSSIDFHFNELRTLFGDIERERLGSFYFPPYYDMLSHINADEESLTVLRNIYHLRQ
jgi:hypothetical protein